LRPAAADDIGKEFTCPVTGNTFKVTKDTQYATVNEQPVYFCCANCPAAFAKEPEKYLAKVHVADCPVMAGNPVTATRELRALVNDDYYYFCCNGCPGDFARQPEQFITIELRDPVSNERFRVKAGQPRLKYKEV